MAKPTTKKKNSISMDQFRSWLEGVEDMQPADWTPDQEQWRRIREKIDLVDVTITDQTAYTQSTPMQRNQPVASLPTIPPLPPRVATVFDNAQIVGGMPTVPSAMDATVPSEGNPFGSFE